MAGERFRDSLGATGDLQAIEIERAMQTHIDQAGDAAFDIGGRRRLVHIDLSEQFGRQVGQGNGAAGRGEDFTTVQQRLNVRQAADQHGAGLDAVADDRNAGDVLQRFHDRAVRQLADVFGHDRVRHLRGVLFQRQGVADRGAHAGNSYRLDIGLILSRRGLGMSGAGCQNKRHHGNAIAQNIFRHRQLPSSFDMPSTAKADCSFTLISCGEEAPWRSSRADSLTPRFAIWNPDHNRKA